MAIRQPKESVPDITLGQVLHWHELQCELVTPLYGGGVQVGVIDEKLPIRASSIRGQLRFWWRLLAKHKADWGFNGNLAEIRKAESRLWGGAGEEVNASLVFLKVTDINGLDAKPWAKYEPHPKGGYKTLPRPESWVNVPYILFPAQGKKPGSADSKEPSTLIKASLTWNLQIAFAMNTSKAQTAQVWETLRWWANFGGLGARTRRGLGAIRVMNQKITPITADEAQNIGCQLVLKPQSNSVYTAWTEAVNKLQSFRQGVNFGRNAGQQPNRPGRSRWSEPDAIRRTLSTDNNQVWLKSDLKTHAPVHKAGNVFPRTAFGLPIIVKFKEYSARDEIGRIYSQEPDSTTLQPILIGENKPRERMASPLILRPYFNGHGWQAAALLLPHKHVDALQLKLIQGNRSFDVECWDENQAQNIDPIRDNNGTDALSAFLNYFEN